jgi:hypothetical protein
MEHKSGCENLRVVWVGLQTLPEPRLVLGAPSDHAWEKTMVGHSREGDLKGSFKALGTGRCC